MKKRLRILLPIAILILAVLTWRLFFRTSSESNTLLVSGNIDVTQVDLAFKISGRLLERLVDEGASVHRDQRVAMLDDTDQKLELDRMRAEAAYATAVLAELEAGSRPEEIARAKAFVQQAEFTLNELERGSRTQEIAEAEAELARAEADERSAASQLALAKADFQRNEKMFEEGVISDQTYDTYKTRYESAKSTMAAATSRRKAVDQRLSLRREGARREKIEQARAALAQAEAQYALVKAGPREETIAQARAKKTAADAAASLSRQRLADTILTAPFDGVVLSTSAEPGSLLTPGKTVLTIGDTANIWLRAFVDETDLGRIRLGQKARVTIDADPDRSWTGRISYISSTAEFTPRSVQTFKERTNLVYRIKIQLDNPDGILKPGMPADAVIEKTP